MNRSGFTKALLIIGFGMVIWAICGAIMYAGMEFSSLATALLVHLVAAPIIAASAAWFYFKRYHFTSPLITAAIFTAIVILMDFFVVALLIEQSFAMFGSIWGTWIPWALIFTATYLSGRRMEESGELTAAVS